MLHELTTTDRVTRFPLVEAIRPPTKLAIGQRNPIAPIYEFEQAEQVPFNPYDLFSYLMAQAERAWIPATVDDLQTLFETEFSASVPDVLLADVATALKETGMSNASPQDDLRRVALVELFVSRYTWGYATAPDSLVNPATVRLDYTDWLGALPDRLHVWLQSATH
jgi:hypothetical protein